MIIATMMRLAQSSQSISEFNGGDLLSPFFISNPMAFLIILAAAYYGVAAVGIIVGRSMDK